MATSSRSRNDLPSWARRRRQPRDPKTGFLKPRHCELYRPGHSVHWIQGLHSTGRPDRRGWLDGIEDNIITIDFGDEVRRYRNHEVERLIEIVRIQGPVRVCASYSILRGGGGYCFSIVDVDEPWIACDHRPLRSVTPEALAERMKSHGGFTVPGRVVLDSLEE